MNPYLFLVLITYSISIYAFKYKTGRGGDLNFPVVCILIMFYLLFMSPHSLFSFLATGATSRIF